MISPPVPAPIAQALARYEEPVRARLLEVRDLAFAVAAETEGVGPLAETLKWGEAAYLTEASRSGTTIRLGVSKAAPGQCAVFFNCQTTLVDSFRAHFADDLAFEGNRAVIVPIAGPLARGPLAFCLRAAMTYHRRNRPMSLSA